MPKKRAFGHSVAKVMQNAVAWLLENSHSFK